MYREAERVLKVYTRVAGSSQHQEFVNVRGTMQKCREDVHTSGALYMCRTIYAVRQPVSTKCNFCQIVSVAIG